jgi:hypothetical protein
MDERKEVFSTHDVQRDPVLLGSSNIYGMLFLDECVDDFFRRSMKPMPDLSFDKPFGSRRKVNIHDMAMVAPKTQTVNSPWRSARDLSSISL